MSKSRQLSPVICSGIPRKITRIRILISVFRIAVKYFGNPISAYRGLKSIIQIRRVVHGNRFSRKFVKADGKYFLALNIPGWPSKAFNSFIKAEFIRSESRNTSLHTAVFSVSSKCNFGCRHCSEWNNLTREETLSIEDLVTIQGKLHDQGISHLQYSGGEPLGRFNDLLELLAHRKEDVDYWMLTSGFELTYEKAKSLKEAGLTGAVVSLDHWDEQQHNTFRHNSESFYWVKAAIRNCRKAGLANGLCLCATKEFISESNLWEYVSMARDWGVGFLRILEPEPVGRYKDMDVQLSEKQLNILEIFFIEVNSRQKYRRFPLVMYPAYHQRRIGCLGTGNRYIYVDPKGDIHPCPFCHKKAGNILEDVSLGEFVRKLRKTGCPVYQTSSSV